MKKYIGTKQVEAELMTMGEAYRRNLLQTGRVPNESEKSNAGYHVKYQDGYESWSPKIPFENAYRPADTPLERMLIEDTDLTVKTEKLGLFIRSDKFNELGNNTKAMLMAQYKSMRNYQHALNMRYTNMENEQDYAFIQFGFDVAVELLKNWFALRRKGWNDKGLFVFKQVPAHIKSDIIPNMQSLPQSAKDLILKGRGYIDYTSQCRIYNTNTGRADSWIPSISDVFAEDWEIVTE